jgi:hypothetical protein
MRNAGSRTQGPRRREWERLKRENDRLRLKIRELTITVASWNDNNSPRDQIDLAPVGDIGEMPPMPQWEE